MKFWLIRAAFLNGISFEVGFVVDFMKIEAMIYPEKITEVSDVWSFLGFMSCYQRFARGFFNHCNFV